MDTFSQEQHMVAESFRKGMIAYQSEPLILYGIGKNTEAVIQLAKDYSIAGLLDANSVGKEFYGKKVLSLEEAAQYSKHFVIIARSAVTPIIFRRIREFTEKHDISVYNYAGEPLNDAKVSYDSSDLGYWDNSWEKLQAEIGQHEVISFDIFDTLLGRYVLHPHDVFSLVERDLRFAGQDIAFKELRIKAESKCGYAASLKEIYTWLHKNGASKGQCRDWCSRELDWEKKMVFPRKRVREAFNFAKKLGKKIFLLTDMYLPREEIEALLSACGIVNHDGLLISSEEKAEKSDGSLFRHLCRKSGGKTILHIGDNRYNDIEMAKNTGIDTWHVYSSYELLLHSSLRGLLEDTGLSLGDRLAVGMLCAHLFEDPFSLHETQGRVIFSQAGPVGQCFFGPWALSFMQWAAKQIEEHKIERFLFPARDGFLFYRIGQIMKKHGWLQGVELKYIKASRRALVTASIRNEKDLAEGIQGRPYYRSKGELLWDWFHLSPDNGDKKRGEQVENEKDIVEYCQTYITQILEEAAYERDNLEAYLKKQGLYVKKKTAVFDFVAAGTVQHYLEKHLEQKMLGLYYAQNFNQEKKDRWDERIIAAFGCIAPYGDRSSLSQTYIMIESVLVDGDGSLLFFDEKGAPICQQGNTMTSKQALSIQEAACEFVSKYLSLFGPEKISLSIAERFVAVLFSPACQITGPVLNAFQHDDTGEIGTGT